MIDRLLDELENVRPHGEGWIARCPSHDDGSPSLSINPGNKGWLVYCHAGCDFAGIIGTAGLTAPELFYDYTPAPPNTATTGLRNLWGRLHPRVFDQESIFQDVAWAMWPHRERQFVLACAQYPEIASASFSEAMKMWSVIRDGFLHTWLEFDQWLRARETAATKLRQTWREERR